MDLSIKGHGFTPTQERILTLLSDGRMHSSEEIMLAIDADGLADGKQLSWHLCKLREKLRKRGQTVALMGYSNGGDGEPLYQWMRAIPSASDGKY